MARQKRKFSREFKLEAVGRVLEGDRSVASIARELGVSPVVLTRWRDTMLQDGALKSSEAPDQELKRLRREVEKLRQERDFLKKAVGFFARDPK